MLTNILKVFLIDQDLKNLLHLFPLLSLAYFLFQTELCVLIVQIETLPSLEKNSDEIIALTRVLPLFGYEEIQNICFDILKILSVVILVLFYNLIA